MGSGCALQITGLIFGGAGMVGTLAATAMPQWRVSAYVDGNLVVFESVWEGLWLGCISQLGRRLQCQPYGSLLALPPPLEALRALMSAAGALAVLAFLLAIVGLQCGQQGPRLSPWLLAAGSAHGLAGTLALIPVSVTGAAIVRDFHDPQVPAPLKRELGAALFVGWASGALLLAAGALLCRCCCCWGRAARHGHPRPGPAGNRPGPGHAYV